MLNKLFETIQIGKTLNLQNRIVMPSMVTGFGNPDGSISDTNRAYYVERAKGGVGLIIVEATAVMRSGRGSPYALSIYNDNFIAGLKSLTDEVHRCGTKIAIQLMHIGRQAPSKYTGTQTVAPSAIPYEGGEMPRELTINEIEEIIKNFGEGARRAKEAGFDAIEIHGAHGYLISEFLSPRVNKRSDKYGGGIAGRAAIALEVVKESRAKVGNDFPILFRISADDYLPGGLTLGETRVIAHMLQEAGVDCIDVSAGTHESWDYVIQPASLPPGCLVHLAAAIKKVVSIPVIAVGRINDPLLAENVLQGGKADLIAIGRGLIVDPELPIKAKAGRFDEIRFCLACRQCVDKIIQKVKVTCAVNAHFGQECNYKIMPTSRPKKVLVAGGGPAGLEAARIAALRGHKVILYESQEILGGQLRTASVPPYKGGVVSLLKSLICQITKLGVEVHLGCNVTPDLVSEIQPDTVVIATGSVNFVPEIPGVRLANVFLATDILAGKKELGKRVVVIGGGQVGCETAYFLATIGKSVVVIARHDVVRKMGVFEKKDLLKKLHEANVAVYTNTTIQEITDRGVLARINNETIHLDAENILIATGSKPHDELVKKLDGKIKEIHIAGDCVEPRNIYNAINEGFQVGLKI